MQPLQRIGLARLVGLLICTAGVVRAGVGYGCNDAPIPCNPPAAFPGPEMKCKRCFLSIETLMERESNNREQEDRPGCRSMVLDTYDGGDPIYYDTSHDPYAQCFTPGFLLYDGALECFALNRSKDVKGTLVGAMEKCLGSMGNFYNCLCSWGIGNSQLANMTPCFYGTKTPNMLEKCPNLARQAKFQYLQPPSTKTGTKPKIPKGRGGKTGNRRSTVPDGSNTNSDDASTGSSNDGSNDGPNTNSNTGDGSNSDYFVDDWPPNVDDQFSPVLEDTDVSFYLDIWERIVLVDTETNEVRYYEPYYLYTALSYDTVFPVPGDKTMKVVRRCWLYPYSNRVWCYQWQADTADLLDYGYVDSNTAVILGPSSLAAVVTASTGDTALPSAYSSVSYTQPGAVPSRTTRAVTDAPATATSPGSTAKPTKGSSSAPASRAGSKSWLAAILLAVMYNAF